MTDGRLPTLAAIEAAVWDELARCVTDREHGWRTATLATVTSDGEADARTIVLREVEPEQQVLRFYTDARSPKLAQLQSRPRACLVLWSKALGWQLRIHAELQAETEGLAVSSRWARLKMTPAAHDYLSPLPPGSELGTPTPERGSRGFFAIVNARVRTIDWLELHVEGQRRALFGDGPARWLQP